MCYFIIISNFNFSSFLVKKKWSFAETKKVFNFGVFFWVYLITLTYTKNLNYGLNNIKIMLPIILLPSIFLVNEELLLKKKI